MATYLGPKGHELYTVKASVADMKSKYGIHPLNPDDKATMLFSPHWSGLYGILPGTNCGDEPLEAFHSPWQKHLATLGKPPYTRVINTMQKLCR